LPATITAGIIPKPRQSILILIDASLSPGLSRYSLRAAMDCIIGLTACSAYDSCGGSFKPIHYAIA